MFWNVENLYDTYDDTTRLDDAFTPGGEMHWNYKRFQRKSTMSRRPYWQLGIGNLPQSSDFVRSKTVMLWINWSMKALLSVWLPDDPSRISRSQGDWCRPSVSRGKIQGTELEPSGSFFHLTHLQGQGRYFLWKAKWWGGTRWSSWSITGPHEGEVIPNPSQGGILRQGYWGASLIRCWPKGLP